MKHHLLGYVYIFCCKLEFAYIMSQFTEQNNKSFTNHSKQTQHFTLWISNDASSWFPEAFTAVIFYKFLQGINILRPLIKLISNDAKFKFYLILVAKVNNQPFCFVDDCMIFGICQYWHLKHGISGIVYITASSRRKGSHTLMLETTVPIIVNFHNKFI